MIMGDKSTTIIVGISGMSTSGKTTVARLLRDTFPRTLILHGDDFYWPDAQIPVKNGIQDWDCLESLDLEKFRRSLQFIKAHGALPPDLDSREDENEVQASNVDTNLVADLRANIADYLSGGEQPRIVIVEGFLLYAQHMQEIWGLMDVRLFLRTRYVTAKVRRKSRKGYVTVDGFWEDPPDYVDDVVWPNYAKDHAFLFVDGDVEGEFDQAACSKMNLRTMPAAADGDMSKCLFWAFQEVRDAVQRQSHASTPSRRDLNS